MPAGFGAHSGSEEFSLGVLVEAIAKNFESLDELQGKIRGVQAASESHARTANEAAQAESKLTSEAQASSSAIGGGTVAMLGATAALGTLTGLVKDSFDSYSKYAEQVRHIQEVTGASAEESSKLVDVFGQLGIDSDKAERALLKMNETLIKSGTAHADVTKSLEEVADRYVQAGTAAERDAIAYEAFGKQAAALIPLLAEGSAGLREMEEASHRAISQEDIDKAHRFSIEQRQLGQDVDHVKDMIGEQITKGLLPWGDLLTGSSDKTRRLAADEDNLVQKNKALERSIRDAAKAQDEATKSVLEAADASFAKREADLRVSESQDRLNQLYKEGRASGDALTQAQLDVEGAMIRDARATADLAAKQAEASGASFTATDKARTQRDALIALEKTLAPDSPLRRDLDAYIALLANIPRSVDTRVTLSTADTGYQNPGRQGGGPVFAGGVYTVGESGPETLIMGSGGGVVLPGASGGGGGGGYNITMHIYGGDSQEVAALVEQRFSRLLTSS